MKFPTNHESFHKAIISQFGLISKVDYKFKICRIWKNCRIESFNNLKIVSIVGKKAIPKFSLQEKYFAKFKTEYLYDNFLVENPKIFTWRRKVVTVWKVSVFVWFILSWFIFYRHTPYLSVFSPNAGKYGLKKFRIRTLLIRTLSQWVKPNV